MQILTFSKNNYSSHGVWRYVADEYVSDVRIQNVQHGVYNYCVLGMMEVGTA